MGRTRTTTEYLIRRIRSDAHQKIMMQALPAIMDYITALEAELEQPGNDAAWEHWARAAIPKLHTVRRELDDIQMEDGGNPARAT